MSLIEYLVERGDWRSSLRRNFEGAIRLLQTDHYNSRIGSDFDEMLEQIASLANQKETWMLANGYTQEDINYIYKIIDKWLVKNGLSRTVVQGRP
ncbi:hypothetical protein NIES4071_102730 (plasmid) [Calothrix sp. NIES-4071]|nr:hypothetical protein NIES4071_102730 [Calothrix sp. NIES-4071]BAZ64654.1 hypothetical protein NIES4105_103870 [Calothrix sp. NIES-4105]